MTYKDKEKIALYISSEILKIQGNPEKQTEFNQRVKAYFELYESLTDEEQNILSHKVENIIQRNKRKMMKKRRLSSKRSETRSRSRR